MPAPDSSLRRHLVGRQRLPPPDDPFLTSLVRISTITPQPSPTGRPTSSSSSLSSVRSSVSRPGLSSSVSTSTASTIDLEPESTSSPTIPTLTRSESTSIVIQTVQATPSSTGTRDASAQSSSNAFLNNKPLAGVVFGLVALISLILLVIAITWGVRRRRRSRLQSISFDPDNTYNPLAGSSVHRQGSQGGTSASGHGHDVNPFDSTASGLYQDYGSQQPQYPAPTVFPQNPGYGHHQQAYYPPPSPQPWSQHPPAYGGFPSALVPGYAHQDTGYPAAPPPVVYAQQQYPTRGLALGRRNDSVSSLPSIANPAQSGFGNGHGVDPSPPSPPLPNPYGDTVYPQEKPPSPSWSDEKPALKSATVVPSAGPLPDHFGSDAGSRSSIEADARFWSRTLKIANQ